MPAGSWQLYNAAKFSIGNASGTDIHLATDSFSIALYLSTSNCGNAALSTPDYSSVLTNEVATAGGYAAGGIALTTSFSGGSSVPGQNFQSSTNPVWTASGSGITARYAVIYDTTLSSKLALCYCLLDATPADVITPSGFTLTVYINGVIFQMN